MKNCKKMLSFVLVAVMMAALCVPAFAGVNEPYLCDCDDPQPESILRDTECTIAWTNATAHMFMYSTLYQCCICNGEIEVVEYEPERHYCDCEKHSDDATTCTCVEPGCGRTFTLTN